MQELYKRNKLEQQKDLDTPQNENITENHLLFTVSIVSISQTKLSIYQTISKDNGLK